MPTFSSLFAGSLMRAWQRRGVLACLLWPLSMLFLLLLTARRALYAVGVLKRTTLAVPVIVIGNIFVGGTGKTPLVIWLIAQLRAQGFTPGVISRGYGSQAEQVQPVSADMSPLQVGDEPLLIAQKTGAPMMVGRKRAAAAQALLTAHPEVNVIVSDDGLQHYALDRSIEIQLSDSRGHGNGWLLPAGPLREPASRRSDFYVVNGGVANTGGSYAMTLKAVRAERLAQRSEQLELSELAKQSGTKNIAAAAGIGNPARFFDMLRAQGVALSAELALPDHFDFASNPFEHSAADIMLITEKDAVKCAGNHALVQNTSLWVVPVEATINGSLAENIVEKLRGHPTA
jgi:tetraacyldisaccharide 4'-kinase